MLKPIHFATESRQRAEERQAEERLARAWPMVVGPALQAHTRLLRVRNHVLFMGCWKPEVIPSLRLSVEAVWPDIRARIERLARLNLQRIDVLPCDPPTQEPPPLPPRPTDPFAAVLDRLQTLHHR
ncbi:MAG: DUF721 domain-containing protein [Firmicutes bacterium]|nr:DUF721 domain-containing protein [Bacillota bacterium]